MLITGWAWAQTPTPAQPPVAQTHAASASSAAKPTNKQHSPAKKGKTKPAEQPEVVQAPPPPPTPEQMPPAQPRVSYQNGQLSIESQNSTLGQVLRSVQAKTGGSFEIPGAANNERVVAQLGPGRPRDVLASLLNGSKFDYIILGVSDEPGAVQKLILTVRKNPASTPANAAQNVPPVQPQDEVQPEDENIPEPVENTPAEVQNVPNQEPGQTSRQHTSTRANHPTKVRSRSRGHPAVLKAQKRRSNCYRSCKGCNSNSNSTSSS